MADPSSRLRIWAPFAASHVLLVALVAVIAVPGKIPPRTSVPFFAAVAVIELVFLWRFFAGGKKPAPARIIAAVWMILIAWELAATDLRIAHPVLVPIPESVFAVFFERWPELLRNVYSSLVLLGEGFVTSLAAATLVGLFVGWLPRVRETVYPVARVLAPIPSIVLAPYLVMLLPSFKVAAVAVIFLGIFWPTLLNTILRVESLDRHIVDSARLLGLTTFQMVFRVLLPYLYPTVVMGLKTQLPSAMLMLVMAEMYGATSGLGYFVINYTNYANYANVAAGVIVVGVVVTLLAGAIGFLERKTVKWR